MQNIKKLERNNKIYKISKIKSVDALKISFKFAKMFSSPILSIFMDFIFSSVEEKENKIDELKGLIENKDGLKKEISGLIAEISDNFEENLEIINDLIGLVKVEETIEKETKEYSLLFKEDFDFDDLDLWIDLICLASSLNFETGLRKTLGKFGILDKMN